MTRITTESERVIARAQRLAPMLRENVYVYSNGREVWLAAARTAKELYADRTPIFVADNTTVPEPMKLAASCTVCGREGCKVAEQFTQATRSEPMRSLGFYGYCPDCTVSFRVEAPQLMIAA